MNSKSHQSVVVSRRRFVFGLFGLGAAVTSGCHSGGGFNLLGYTTEPNYDPSIQTVYVPIFKSKVFETTPYRGMEFKLTREVIDQIEAKTPFKVISDPDRADTELQGTITVLQKNIINRTPFNETRDTELVLGVEIVWHDLRPGQEGKILTNPQRKRSVIEAEQEPFDPLNPRTPEDPQKPRPVYITDAGRIVPELGESTATGLDMVLKRIAVKVVSAMERPW